MNFFVVLEGLTIFSMIYTPAPWFSTWGYPPHAVGWSMGLGIVLGTVAYFSAVMKLFSLKTHQLIAALIGVICLILSAVSFPDAFSPRAIFMVYGIVLTFGAGAMIYLSSRREAEPIAEESPEERESEERRAA